MIKLHLGSGHKRYKGYINVDYDEHCKPDVVLNLEKDNFPWEDNSVSGVIAHHVFEHLGDGYFHFLQELYRVCENGALIDVVVPHHRHDYFLNDPTHKRPITVDGMLLFSKKHNQYCIDINDGSSKLGMFYNVDFEIVETNFKLDENNPLLKNYMSMAKQLKEGTQEQKEFEAMVRERNNIISETHFKLKVIKNDK